MTLVLQRSEKSGLGGKWSLPGGGLEDGEDSIEGIKREIVEETTSTVSQIEPYYVKSYKENDDFIVMIGYTCTSNLEDVKLNWEHDSYKWLTKEEALKLDLTSDGRTFIEQFNN
ncbi:MAG: NUDIX hydrolase [candidate division WS6 bacterium GW2011_GWC1_36_11]|uniref:8-oxo-dGTP diphosphatase n=1 Tax=candidate division WS6 bacterium GW2011_GWC1_36_11 TaxID=1619090 RepID=A0A0G0DCY4_9BACT|nr:MAG: NUDIX hydrolase [candidate division WS6 bacterium GW2011_GWC1_36_11]